MLTHATGCDVSCADSMSAIAMQSTTHIWGGLLGICLQVALCKTRGKLNDAVEGLKTYLQHWSNDREAWEELGDLYLEVGKGREPTQGASCRGHGHRRLLSGWCMKDPGMMDLEALRVCTYEQRVRPPE